MGRDLVVHASQRPAAPVVRDAALGDAVGEAVGEKLSGIPRACKETAVVLVSLEVDLPDAWHLRRSEDHATSSLSFRQVNASA